MHTAKARSGDRYLHTEVARLLRSASRAFDAELQVWSERLEVICAFPPADPSRIARSRGAAGRAAAHRRLVRDTGEDGWSCLAAPICTRAGLAAVLTMARPSAALAGAAAATGAFLEDLARLLGQHLDRVEESTWMMDRLSAAHSDLDLLQRLTQRLARGRDLRSTLEFILEEGRDAAAADAAFIGLPARRMLLLAPRSRQASPAAGLGEPAARRICERLGERSPGAAGCARQTEAAKLFHPGRAPVSGATRLAAASPGAAAGQGGVLCLLKTDGSPFSDPTLRLLESLAGQVDLALQSAERQQSDDAFLLATVRALVSTIEAKDRYTSGHSTRVHLVSMLLGKHLGLDSGELDCLKWASLLHDVGKIGMPEAILNKPGRLTEEEFRIVKQHSQRGYQVLSHIPQLQDASQAVLLHHERFGGGGYPLGIAAEGIPRPARIIAVADTFDALTSRRSYREARTQDEALTEILRVRGTQLDPEIVGAFESVLPFLRENLVMAESAVG
jgi:hypothetical protein